MTDLFTFVTLFDQRLGTASHLLDRGEAAGGADVLGWRLVDDMYPLAFQLRNVIHYAWAWPARVVGDEPPAEVADDLDIAGYRVAIADARAYLAGLTAERFAGRDDMPLTAPVGPGLSPTMPAGRWLTGFASTSLHFHVSMIYAILRARGVPIGKRDLFAGGL